jgi:hypothetical protein
MEETGESYTAARRHVLAANTKPSQCEFCRAAIIWAEWMPNPRARKKLDTQVVPLDVEPNDRVGVIALTERPGQRPLAGEMTRNQAAGYRERGGHTYVQHAKTCVKADELKRKIVARHARR